MMLQVQGAPLTAQQIFHMLSEVRRTRPLVHNLANFVAMNFTANALLALGASPVMAHAQEEMGEMVNLAQSLVINIGTLDEPWVASMKTAVGFAREYGRPVVLDPVGAGATKYRTEVALELAGASQLSVIRGNASEILSFAGSEGNTKGVDSQAASHAARSAAQELSARYNCVVCVSGETDFIIKGKNRVAISNGHPLMARVTGMGCVASSLIGAFLSVEKNAFKATQAAMAIMSIAGELAAEQAKAPGTFQVKFLDALSEVKSGDLQRVLLTSDV